MASHTNHRQAGRKHTNTDSTNGLILHPSLAEQDRGPLGSVHTDTHTQEPLPRKALETKQIGQTALIKHGQAY